MREIREAIKEGKFPKFRADFTEKYEANEKVST